MKATIPTPIVSWETLVSLSDPMHKPSRQRLRTLRGNDWLSDGITVVERRGNRAAGKFVYYSACSALAAKAKDAGQPDVAHRLGEAGGKIEKWIQSLLADFLATHPVSDLSEAPFYDELVKRTSDALERIQPDFVILTGQIQTKTGELARVVAEMKSNVFVDIPTDLFEDTARPGDHVWVMRQIVGKAALITVLPAVSTAPANDEDGLGRDYMITGPGAPISEAEIDFLRGIDKSSLPTAQLIRPAG